MQLFIIVDLSLKAQLTLAKSTFKLKKGDKIVITGGITNGGSGSTNLIKLETL